jgi:hypothetical protein
LAIRISILNAGKKLHRVIGVISNTVQALPAAIHSCAAAKSAKVHVPSLPIEIQEKSPFCYLPLQATANQTPLRPCDNASELGTGTSCVLSNGAEHHCFLYYRKKLRVFKKFTAPFNSLSHHCQQLYVIKKGR